MDDIAHRRASLGSLSQSARSKNLKQARWTLIVVGLLTCAINGFMLFNVHKEADKAIADEVRKQPGVVLDPNAIEEAKADIISFGRLIYGGTVALGVVFIGLGIAVYQIPVVATVLGLVLYIGANIFFVALTGDPKVLAHGFILKIIIIVGLFKAVQSAIAYQRESAAAVVSTD